LFNFILFQKLKIYGHVYNLQSNLDILYYLRKKKNKNKLTNNFKYKGEAKEIQNIGELNQKFYYK
jgi:hypothetical protein